MAETPPERTDKEWAEFIQEKINQVLSAPETITDAPFASISVPEDPRFPQTIDHTLLKQDAVPAQITALCNEAKQYGFKSVCVHGLYVTTLAKHLEGTQTIVCCVVGFPLGTGTAESKACEARNAIKDGAKEIDMVIPLGLLLSNPPLYTPLFKHIKTVVDACAPIPVKVILETRLIPSDWLKVTACVLAAEAGAAFVKTSTGFAPGPGASKYDVNLMYRSVKYKGNVKVKASGGIRTFDDCMDMFAAGAERIGTSSAVSFMQNSSGGFDDY